MSGHDAFVDDLFLVRGFHKVSVNELGHFQIVGEHVEREIDAFGNRNELMLFLILLRHWVHCVLVFSPSASFKGGKRSDPLFKAVIHVQVSYSETGVLTVEETCHREGFSVRVIKLELVEHEGLVVVFENFKLEVLVSEVSHAVKLVSGDAYLFNERLGRLAHHKHGEVVFLQFVGVVHVLKNLTESILELLVGNSGVRVSANVDAIHLLKLSSNLFFGVEVANWDNDYT